ncbi:MAG: hypothetical protein ACYDC0_12900 [Acidimicrobiales bacterium]
MGGIEQFGDRDRLGATGAFGTGSQLLGERVARLAVLLAEQPGVAVWAQIDGVRRLDERLAGCLVPPAPGGLPTGVRAVEPAP